jgi:hypothetical protein
MTGSDYDNRSDAVERSKLQHIGSITWIKLYWRLYLAFVNKANLIVRIDEEDLAWIERGKIFANFKSVN